MEIVLYSRFDKNMSYIFEAIINTTDFDQLFEQTMQDRFSGFTLISITMTFVNSTNYTNAYSNTDTATGSNNYGGSTTTAFLTSVGTGVSKSNEWSSTTSTVSTTNATSGNGGNDDDLMIIGILIATGGVLIFVVVFVYIFVDNKRKRKQFKIAEKGVIDSNVNNAKSKQRMADDIDNHHDQYESVEVIALGPVVNPGHHQQRQEIAHNVYVTRMDKPAPLQVNENNDGEGIQLELENGQSNESSSKFSQMDVDIEQMFDDSIDIDNIHKDQDTRDGHDIQTKLTTTHATTKTKTKTKTTTTTNKDKIQSTNVNATDASNERVNVDICGEPDANKFDCSNWREWDQNMVIEWLDKILPQQLGDDVIQNVRGIFRKENIVGQTFEIVKNSKDVNNALDEFVSELNLTLGLRMHVKQAIHELILC